MTKLQQAIIIMNSFSAGILVPVLNLILLEKGSNLQTLPLLLAIYAMTILFLELPSGICADIYGRKTVYLLSCIFQFISFSFLAGANNIIWLALAIVFLGLGRAFSSGSLDALFIDQALTLHGEECIAKITTRIAVLDGVGLAIGGVVGGILSDATNGYIMNIVFRIVFAVVLFVLCLFFVKEQPTHDIKERISLIEHIREGKQLVCSTPKFGLLLIGVFFIGFLLCTLETYWQPAFMQILNTQNRTWILGIITSLGFFAVVAGNTIAQRLLDTYSNSWWSIYNNCRVIFSICVMVFAFQKNVKGFIIGYTGIYLLLGASNVVESTLINKLTPNHMRASVLSLNSFVIQMGVLGASVFSSFMIFRLRFSGIWIVASVLLGGYAIIMTVITRLVNSN